MAPKGKKKGGGTKAKKGVVKGSNIIVHRLWKTYERNCLMLGSAVSQQIKSDVFECLDHGNVLFKFILRPIQVQSADEPVILIEPLLIALRQERYPYIKHLHIWEVPMNHEETASLALLMEKRFYPIKVMEIINCFLQPSAIQRLSLAFNPCESLSTIILDHNEFGDEGCQYLCEGLICNVTVTSLSLCFCDLGVKSGIVLGNVLTHTAVSELYLDGNDLGCDGTVELIKGAADYAEQEMFLREQERLRKEQEELEMAEEEMRGSRLGRYGSAKGSASDGERSPSGGRTKGIKKKKKKGKKKKGPPPPPPVGPWVRKLHLADNGIDVYNQGQISSLICMRLIRKLLTNSECFEELDIDDNLIGDLGGRELLEALLDRKDVDLPGVKVRTTHRLMSNTFNDILKLATGLKKKKKKGKKKKK